MNIYQLSVNYQRLMDKVLEAEELSPELMNEVEFISDSLEDKLLNYTSIIKMLEAQADSICKECNKMEERAMKIENRASQLKELVRLQMIDCAKEKIENDYHEIKIMVNNPRTDIFDEQAIPNDYWKEKVKTTIDIDRIKIANDIKNGILVPGAKLVRDLRLQIK